MIMTERYKYVIFSKNYGIELEDLFGMPMTYVIPEVQRRITETLTWDTRIKSVDKFTFKVTGHDLLVTFTARTIFGDVQSGRTVTV